MKRLRFEQKIVGINAVWILLAFVVALVLMAALGGELLTLSYLGFEVIAPFVAAVAVCEWGKTRADANYDIIAAQSKSLFRWVLARTLAVFLTASLFVLAGMLATSLIRNELPLWELLLLYLSPALLLSGVGALCGVCFTQEHISTLICGVMLLSIRNPCILANKIP